jgi:hypothetical protein
VAITVDQAFRPPGEAWQAISPQLSVARRVVLALCVVPITVLAVAVLLAVGQRLAAAAVGVAATAFFVWLWWLIGRRVRSFGYVERADDLLVTSGILFRRLVIVPYGRMQLVDLVAGPIDRAMGLATVQLHTAAATTDAKIPGLSPDVAASLRDRLAAHGEQRSAGL